MIELNMNNLTSPEVVEQVIATCYEVFYNASNGSAQELDAHIQDEVKKSFVSFFGEQHKDRIEKRVDETKIVRCFEILKGHNSIEKYLENTLKDKFNKGKTIPFDYPNILPLFNSMPLEEILRDCPAIMKDFCDFAGINMDTLQTPEGQQRCRNLIGQYAKEFSEIPYSEDPKRNSQMLYLEQYVNMYRAKVPELLEDVYATKEDFYKEPYLRLTLDPVFSKLFQSVPVDKKASVRKLLMVNEGTVAFKLEDMVAFGAVSGDSTVIHEFVHRLTPGISLPRQKIEDMFRQNEIFNEVITDWFSEQINDRRIASGQPSIVDNSVNIISGYNNALFKTMEPFMKTFTPEIKEALMTDNPVASLTSMIGENPFNSIGQCCNIMYEFGHTRSLLELGADQKYREGRVGVESGIQDSLKEKSLARRVLTNISLQGEQLANSLGSKSPHLRKLAGAIYAMSDLAGQLNQRQVRADLQSKGLDVKWQSEQGAEKQESAELDNEMVMEMSF